MECGRPDRARDKWDEDFDVDAQVSDSALTSEEGIEPEHPLSVRAGIASHGIVVQDTRENDWAAYVRDLHALRERAASDLGLTAGDLAGIDVRSPLREARAVLLRRHWISRSGKTHPILENIIRQRCGDEVIAKTEDTWRDEPQRTAAFIDIALRFEAKPFTRLWYAANFYVLAHLHPDPYRLGFLYAEYKFRREFEPDLLKRTAQIEANRENGERGGRGQEKREKYQVLDAWANTQDFSKLSDKAKLILARQFTWSYDRSQQRNGRAPIFVVSRNNPVALSSDWFRNWLAHYHSES